MDIKLKILAHIIVYLLCLTKPSLAKAGISMVTASAEVKNATQVQSEDLRVVALTKYLKSMNSPISEHAGTFISAADRNNLDWRLVASIAGVESTFGKRIPYNSYNAYGWANGDYKFKSWDNSINHVSEVLNNKYYNKNAANINKIARRYAPPSSTWAGKVKYFMKKIEPIPVVFDL